jgi:hypothetical protein
VKRKSGTSAMATKEIYTRFEKDQKGLLNFFPEMNEMRMSERRDTAR